MNPGSGLPYRATGIALTYYGATNNIETITYLQGATPVMVRTITYVGGGAADDDTVSGFTDATP